MRIVLNAREMESLKEFLNNYVGVCADTVIALDPDDSESVRICKMSNDELRVEMVYDIKHDMPCCVCTGTDAEGNFHVDIDDKLFIKYFECVNKSMVAIDPYTCKLIQLVVKHKESLVKASEKIQSLLAKKTVMTGVKFVANLIGIGAFVDETTDMVDEMMNDNMVDEAMKDIEKDFNSNCYKYC